MATVLCDNHPYMFKEFQNSTKSKAKLNLLRAFGYAGIAILPILASIALVRITLHSRLADFHPAWSDEVIYWQSINTFKEYGFNGGYFTFEELPAESGRIQMGTHGAAFAVLYGGIARILGWELNSGPEFNLFIIGIAIFLALWMMKPNYLQLVLFSLLIPLAFPMLFYLPSNMQESLNHALAILLGAFIIKVTKGGTSSPLLTLSGVLLVFIASLVRITWIFAFFPLIYFLLRNPKRKVLKTLIISGVLSILAFQVFSWWTSPYPDWFFYNVFGPGIPLADRISAFLSRIIENTKLFFDTSNGVYSTELILRGQFLLVLLLLVLTLKNNRKVALSGIFLLSATLLAVVALYDVGKFRDYRFLSPIVMLGLILLVSMTEKKSWLKWGMVALVLTSVLSMKGFLNDYQMHLNQFGKNWDPLGDVYTTAIGEIEFRENADPWCNSLLTQYISGENFKMLAPGIGLNIVLDPGRMTDIRSHYLFASPNTIAQWGLQDSYRILFEDENNVVCERTDDGC